MRFFPRTGFVDELSDLPAIPELLEMTLAGPGFDRPVFFGHNCIAASNRIEKLDHLLGKETRIASKPDAGATHLGRGLGQADFEKRNRTGMGGGISTA